MSGLWAPHALLGDRWAAGVRLTVDGGTIVGLAEDTAPAAGDRVLGGPVVPGMPNLHSHAFQRALAGLTQTADPAGGHDSFWTWRALMYRFVDRLGPDEVQAIAAWLGVELLEGGFTRVAEFHYLHHGPGGRRLAPSTAMARAVVAGLRSAGLGVTLLPVLYQTGDFGGVAPGAGQARFLCETDELLGMIDELRDLSDPELRVGLAPHSLRAVPPGALAAAVAGLHALDPSAPVHVHVAEQPREVAACLDWSGQRPVAWLLDHAPVDARWCLVHATHVTPEEVRGIADSKAVLGLCPTTEADLGDGVFPLAGFLEAGGRLGVGTDSHVGRSAAGELALLEYGQRLVRGGRNLVRTADERATGAALWRRAAAGGAQALGQPCGRLAVGQRADLVVLDADHPSLWGRTGDAWLDSLVLGGSPDTIDAVYVSGRPVVAGGRHPERARHAAGMRRALATLLG